MKNIQPFILLFSSLLFGFNVNWNGNVGGFIVRSQFSNKRDNFSVQSAEFGVSILPAERSETSIKLLFFDLLPGSFYYNQVTPFLSEAFVSFPIYTQSSFFIKLGRQRFTYGDGLLLFDYWIGEDALKIMYDKENFGIEGFYIRVLENFISGYRYETSSVDQDKDIIGVFSSYEKGVLLTEGLFIRGIGYKNSPLWFENRWVFENQWLKLKFDGSLLLQRIEDNQWAFVGEAKRNFFNTIWLGISYFYLSSKWYNPLGYAYVHDEFYNGWGSGFGETIPWAILPWSLKGFEISDIAMEPGAIFWINPHNLSVLNLNLSKNLGEKLSFRIDAFAHKLADSEKKFGKELTFNLNYLAPGDIDVGLSLGLFKPGEFFGNEFNVNVIKLWFIKSFSF